MNDHQQATGLRRNAERAADMQERHAQTRVLWRTSSGSEAFLAALQRIAGERGLKSFSRGADEIRITVPMSLLRRRRQSMLTGAVSHSGEGVEISWIVSAQFQEECLLSLEESLPEAFFDYRGLLEAASSAGFTFSGRAAIRNVMDSLGRREAVTAAGRGQLGDAEVVVALTTQRIVIADVKDLAPPYIEVHLRDVERLSLGKKKTGETLTLAFLGTDVVISHLGHGEGHGVVSRFRQAKKDLERTSPLLPAQSPKHPLGRPETFATVADLSFGRTEFHTPYEEEI